MTAESKAHEMSEAERPVEDTQTLPPRRKQPKKSGQRGVVERVDDWWYNYRFRIFLVLMLVVVLVLLLWSRIFVLIPSGHRGVMFRTFTGGTVKDRIWGEGFHIIPPWDTVTVYETRLQERTLEFHVLSKEGLRIDIIASVRFHPLQERLGDLHTDIGPLYFERLIQPEIESHLRETVGDRTAYQLYSNEGDILQEASRLDLGVTSSATSYIRIDELLIRTVSLPAVVRGAIEQKHRQEQLLLEYDFRVARSEKEAERKRIEATGIRDYNTIAKDISPELLRWRGIDATLDLAKSNNAKVIVIGGGQDGLPLILDTRTDNAPNDAMSEKTERRPPDAIDSPPDDPSRR